MDPWDGAPKLAARLEKRAGELAAFSESLGSATATPPPSLAAGVNLARVPAVILSRPGGDQETEFERRLEFCAAVTAAVDALERAGAELLTPAAISAVSSRSTELAAQTAALVGEGSFRDKVEGALGHLTRRGAEGSLAPDTALSIYAHVGRRTGLSWWSALMLDQALPPGDFASRAHAAWISLGCAPDDFRVRNHPISSLGTIRDLVPRGKPIAPDALPLGRQSIDVTGVGTPRTHVMYDPDPLLRNAAAGAPISSGLTTKLVGAYRTVLETPVTKVGGGESAARVGAAVVITEDGRTYRAAGRALDPAPSPAHVFAMGRLLWARTGEAPGFWGPAGNDPDVPRVGPVPGVAPFRTRLEGHTPHSGAISDSAIVRDAVAAAEATLESEAAAEAADEVAIAAAEEAAVASVFAAAFFPAAARAADMAGRPRPGLMVGRVGQELALSTLAQYEGARSTLLQRLRRDETGRSFKYRLETAMGATRGPKSRRVMKREAFHPKLTPVTTYLLGAI